MGLAHQLPRPRQSQPVEPGVADLPVLVALALVGALVNPEILAVGLGVLMEPEGSHGEREAIDNEQPDSDRIAGSVVRGLCQSGRELSGSGAGGCSSEASEVECDTVVTELCSEASGTSG